MTISDNSLSLPCKPWIFEKMSKQKKDLFQAHIFSLIEKKLPENKRLTMAIAEVLEIEPTNCYKRVRGEVTLPTDELVKLVKAFNLSLDHLIADYYPEHTFMYRPAFIYSEEEMLSHLQGTYQRLTHLPGQDHCLYYAARDMPLFFYFLKPALTRFKLYVWLSSIDSDLKNKLSMDKISGELQEVATAIGALYNKLNTVELWTDHTIINQLKQMELYFQTGLITHKDLMLLCDEIEEVLGELLAALENRGIKKERGHFSLYRASFLMMANNSLVWGKKVRMGFISYAGINYLQSVDEYLCENLHNWFQQQLTLSISLGTIERERRMFFNNMTQRIQYLRDEADAKMKYGF